MASSSIIAACRQRERYFFVSAPIIPKGTVIGNDKEGNEIKAPHNLVGRGTTYRKPKENSNED